MFFKPFFSINLTILVFFSLLILIFWVWIIIDCLRSKLETSEKLIWILIILIFNVIGALLYLIFSKGRKKKIIKTKKFKGKNLVRSKKNKVIAGVCGGNGNYLDIDPVLLRLLWVLLILVSFGTGILAYIIAWIIIPKEK